MVISAIKNIIGKLTLVLDFSKKNSPTTKVDARIGSVETQIYQTNVHHGLSYYETKDLIESVIDQRNIPFRDEAIQIYNARIGAFKDEIFKKIDSLSSDEIEKLKEPDTQIALLEAAKISGRKQDENLKKLLANLVINRIKKGDSDKEELKNIVYNEAILTVNKLTIDQIKIITLCYLLRYTQLTSMDSWISFRIFYLRNTVRKFLDFNNTPTEFQHIEYTGCGSLILGIANWDLISTFRKVYSISFMNLVERDMIDCLSLTDDMKKDFFELNESENKYFIPFRDKESFNQYLTGKGVETAIKNRLLEIFESHIKNNDEIRGMILNCSDTGKKLIDVWDTSYLKYLSLTSVGIAIGACYFEQITGSKLDINIWIN